MNGPALLIAHGIGGRSDLPIPRALAVQGAAVAVFASFVAVALLWREPKLTGGAAGRPVPLGLQQFIDAPATRFVVRLLVLAVTAFAVVAGVAGSPEGNLNIAPWLFYIWFWVGVMLVLSLLFGPVWRFVNPLRLAHALLARLSGSRPEEGLRPLPPALGYWPAVVSLAAFLWLELVYVDRDSPYVVSVFMAVYIAVHLGAAAVFGSDWFTRGDGFEVYSAAVGRLSVFGRRNDGRLVVRNPLNGLAAHADGPGFVAVIAVLVGSTAFDGVTRTVWWGENVRSDDTLRGTLGLFGCIVAVGVLYTLAARAAGNHGSEIPKQSMPGAFAASLIPISIGYGVAHYFSLLIGDGQKVLQLASNPLGNGTDYFGTAGWKINYALLVPGMVALVQVAAIVIGHIVGVVSAHDTAARVLPPDARQRGQFPMIALMVGLTCLGVYLLFGSG